jgi:transposase
MKGFVVLPRRWAVERTFSWFGRNRRLAKGPADSVVLNCCHQVEPDPAEMASSMALRRP